MQAANIFPEFFHCSGVAVFGKATRGGTLLHARVLDYMTEVGLQDEAVTMAIEREGARRFVNVGYAGFIGSVTGMNEKKVAIGEMAVAAKASGTARRWLCCCVARWRTVTHWRKRSTTCVAGRARANTTTLSATANRAPRVVWQRRLRSSRWSCRERPCRCCQKRVEDAVLLSAGHRYKELVKRVRDLHGRIGVGEMQRIIARGVAMKENLHDAIFEPAALTLWIANASRHRPACDERFVKHTWDGLFPPR